MSSLCWLRRSAVALALSVAAWATGCATPQPMLDPSFASRAYAPARIALLPPDVFVVIDQVGDNDQALSAAVGQAVSADMGRLLTEALGRRGYAVDLSTRWDGIYAQDGTPLIQKQELDWLANGIVQFANSDAGGGEGVLPAPRFVAPELAARVGWATQSDALLYANLKGVSVTPGKKTAQVFGVIFFVVIVAAIIAAMVASSKGGGSRGGPKAGSGGGGWRGGGGAPVPRGTGTMVGRPVAPAGVGRAPVAPVRPVRPAPVRPIPPPPGARVFGPNVHVGVGVYVPLTGPEYTHSGNVVHDDDTFAGDDLYISMTLLSTTDGRVLWHVRQNLDLDPNDPSDVRKLVDSLTASIPPAAGQAPAAGAPAQQ